MIAEGVFEPDEADPEAVEEEAYEDELAWKLNVGLIEQVGEMWVRASSL